MDKLERETQLKETLELQHLKLKRIPELDMNKIEILPLEVLKENFDDYKRCESKWNLLPNNPIDFVKQRFAEMRKILAENYPKVYYPYYEEEVMLNNLKQGKTVEDMTHIYRIQTKYEKCPLCGCSLFGMQYAISRRDNKTHICSDCGQQEAMQDMMNVRE